MREACRPIVAGDYYVLIVEMESECRTRGRSVGMGRRKKEWKDIIVLDPFSPIRY